MKSSKLAEIQILCVTCLTYLKQGPCFLQVVFAEVYRRDGDGRGSREPRNTRCTGFRNHQLLTALTVGRHHLEGNT